MENNAGGFIMTSKCDKFLKEELAIVKKIKNDEIWYEGERLNHPITENDANVLNRVNQIISEHLSDIEQDALNHCFKSQEECHDCIECKKLKK